MQTPTSSPLRHSSSPPPPPPPTYPRPPTPPPPPPEVFCNWRMETAGPNGAVEDTDTTVEIRIKTLDSQTYTLRVNKHVPVPALKEQVTTVTGVLSEQQRLICRGRVLKDDELLSAYHVENGHTLHLVSRQRPVNATVSEGASVQQEFSSASANAHTRSSHLARTIVFEAVNIDQGDRPPSNISRILTSMLNTIASTGNIAGISRSGLGETGSERLERASDDSGSSHVFLPQASQASSRADADSRHAAFQFPSEVNLGFQQPAAIPDSLTAMHQYIDHLRDAFRESGVTRTSNAENSGVNIDEQLNHGFQSRPVSGYGGLPSPTSLAEILLSARELLSELAGERLSQLARQLQSQERVMDSLLRMNIQSSAVTLGPLLQNMGSLLLELGRATMTLNMGRTPAEAIVNAGPPVYISTSSPNAMMVQPASFNPGLNFGAPMGIANSGLGVEGQPLSSAFLSRNIGHRIPVSSPNLAGQSGRQQAHEQTGSLRNSSPENFVHQEISGTIGSSPLIGESGVRVVPIRTVLAIPAGADHSPSDSSSSLRGVLYPLFAGTHRENFEHVNGARDSQSSTEPHSGGPETYWQPILESPISARDGSNLNTNAIPVTYVTSASTNASAQYQGIGGSSEAQQSLDREGQGLFFSNLVHQLMPHISQETVAMPDGSPVNVVSSTTHRGSSIDPSSSQHCRDPVDAPNPKRPKRELQNQRKNDS